MSKQLGMVFDTTRCFGCQTCVVSCKVNNQVPGDIYRSHVLGKGGGRFNVPLGDFPNCTMAFEPITCNHCADPACVANCPTGAMHKNSETGIVEGNDEVCVGCGTCVRACPYGAPSVDMEAKLMNKCDLCRERLDKGELPYCVEGCPGMARTYGDIADPSSSIAKRIEERQATVLKPEEGTNPSIYYI